VQGWHTLGEVARELGITDRTLRLRLKEAGIYPARPGRVPMLSDADVTKLMEQSRRRGRSSNPASEQPSSGDTPQQRGRNRQDLLTQLMELQRLVDKSV
jgi:hypothetical protein